MTILLVGRKEVGKTSLIKYILGPYVNSKIIDEYFTLYTSNKINLRLIEVKGVWFDENITPEKIKEKIKNFIDIMNKSNENQNFNNVVNCIWYCVSGRNFEQKEKSLFFSLVKLYGDNTVPIIIVFTKADEKEELEMMRQSLRNDKYKINNKFIPVVAEESEKETPFGKDELINTTLEKSKEALEGVMRKIMIDQISKYIEFKLNKENENLINEKEKRTLYDLK